jgi:RNA polymerase sigma-54 factor
MMNNLELQEYLDEELLKNPFLVRQRRCDEGCDFIERLPSHSNPLDEIFRETAFGCFSDEEKEITEMLVHNIGEDKYLNDNLLKHISQEKGIAFFDLLKIIHKLKKTSFAQMFTFNLQDKVKTFLENENLYTNVSRKLVENLDLVSSRNWSTLKSRCGISQEELLQMVSSLKNAFAVMDFREDVCLPKRVDLLLTEECASKFKIAIDDSTKIEVEFDNDLYAELTQKSLSTSDKMYVKNHASTAKMLVKAINTRNSTLIRIANEIAYRQSDFFLKKDAHLVPLSSKSIAYSLFLHESTVNRALLHKTIATPRGIFELKELLPRKIKSQENKISDYSVKEFVKLLIGSEPKSSPYSDERIADILRDRGVIISRRTISKYRDILHIPNMTERTQNYKTLTATLPPDAS